MNKLTVENIHLRYGPNPVLKGVSFDLRPGEVVALLGASGSGKTTVLRAIAGLEQPSRGRIAIGDGALYDADGGVDLPAEKRNLGLVFQSYALWPHRTVFENVAYGLKLRNIAARDVGERVNKALASLGLGDLGERYPHQLSGGQQQRVAIARALVYNPPVILLDEPLSNLDAKLREEARAWLRELIVTMHLSAIVVTHDQTEAMAMADRILLLKDGRIEQEGPPEQMYAEPRTLYSAEFMGSNNHLAGRVAARKNGRARIQGAGWELWGTPRTDCKTGDAAVGVIRLERVGIGAQHRDNCLAAKLVTSMYLGDRWESLFLLGETRLRCYSDVRPQGETHWLELPAEALWIFPDPMYPRPAP